MTSKLTLKVKVKGQGHEVWKTQFWSNFSLKGNVFMVIETDNNTVTII